MTEEIKSRTKVGDLAEGNISPFHVETEPVCPRPYTDPHTQVSAKLRPNEKSALYALIRSKGCDGLTQFLRLLAKAERVEITL